MSIIKTAIDNFPSLHEGEIKAKLVATGGSKAYFSTQDGVKYKSPIHTVDVDPVFQEGFGCVNTPSGSTTFNFREIEVCKDVAMLDFCLSDLETTAHNERLSPGSVYNNTGEKVLSEAYNSLVEKLRRRDEMKLWDVAGANGCSVNALYQLTDSSNEASINVISTPRSGSDLTANIKDEVAKFVHAIPEEAKGREDITIFMNSTLFGYYVEALHEDNNYNVNVEQMLGGQVREIAHPYMPGVRIVGTVGLGTSERIVAGPSKLVFVGMDTDESTKLDAWYEIKDDKVYVRSQSKLGVQLFDPALFVTNDVA